MLIVHASMQDGPVEAINSTIHPGNHHLDLVHAINEPSADVDAVEKLMAALFNTSQYRCSGKVISESDSILISNFSI